MGMLELKKNYCILGLKFYCDHTSTCCNGAYVKHFAAGSG